MPPEDPLAPLGITAADLAPDDTRSADFDWTGLGVHFVAASCDDDFAVGYAALWDEFGDKGEMETRTVLDRRLAWRPEHPTAGGYARLYEMLVVREDGVLAAVRDHTAVVDLNRPHRPAVVHLSHLLVSKSWRGSGIAGWMRALPLYTARACLTRSGRPARPIDLVAEMEPAAPHAPDRLARLLAYERAGFRKVDPSRVDYVQPDFRRAAAIEAAGGPQPVPLSLVVRRVGREDETTITGAELRACVEAIYAVYEDGSRPQDMAALHERLADYPADDAVIELIKPSAV